MQPGGERRGRGLGCALARRKGARILSLPVNTKPPTGVGGLCLEPVLLRESSHTLIRHGEVFAHDEPSFTRLTWHLGHSEVTGSPLCGLFLDCPLCGAELGLLLYVVERKGRLHLSASWLKGWAERANPTRPLKSPQVAQWGDSERMFSYLRIGLTCGPTPKGEGLPTGANFSSTLGEGSGPSEGATLCRPASERPVRREPSGAGEAPFGAGGFRSGAVSKG